MTQLNLYVLPSQEPTPSGRYTAMDSHQAATKLISYSITARSTAGPTRASMQRGVRGRADATVLGPGWIPSERVGLRETAAAYKRRDPLLRKVGKQTAARPPKHRDPLRRDGGTAR